MNAGPPAEPRCFPKSHYGKGEHDQSHDREPAGYIRANLAAVVVRDISIRLNGNGVGFDGCHEVEISDCLISGRSTDSALLNVGRVQRFTLANNMIQAAGDTKPTAPEKLLKAAPVLSKIFELVDERDFAPEVVVVAEGLAKLSPGERARMAKTSAPPSKVRTRS